MRVGLPLASCPKRSWEQYEHRGQEAFSPIMSELFRMAQIVAFPLYTIPIRLTEA